MHTMAGGHPDAAADAAIAVPMKRAAEIIGVSRSRLRNWRNMELVAPSAVVDVWDQDRWFYGLSELAAGRVAKVIEDAGVDIRRLANQVHAYRSPDHPNPLVSYHWGVDRQARKVFGSEDGVHYMGDGDHHDQYVGLAVIDLAEITAEVRAAATERRGAPGHVSKDRGKFRSKQVFSGTRVRVAAVMSWIEYGADDARILEAYPALSAEDILWARRECAGRAG
jgi:uncharacterized protein (DUF433 family)